MDLKNKTTSDLIAIAYGINEEDEYWSIIAELHSRGTSSEFNAAQTLISSPDPVMREIGADILGQLGCSKKTFHIESVTLLINLLNDSNDDVIASAAFSLGHRNDLKAVPHLLPLIHHANPRVRWGCTMGLSCLDNDDAVSALIQLSKDDNSLVREWATFGLASQCDANTPALRDALLDHLSDEDCAIRGDAFIGLAMRKDLSIQTALINELNGAFNGNWAIQAAELLAQPEYLPTLQQLKNRLADNLEPRFRDDLDNAILACSPQKNQPKSL